MALGVDGWPDATGYRRRHQPVSAPAPVDDVPGAPAWWGEGENADAFLLAQGVVPP